MDEFRSRLSLCSALADTLLGNCHRINYLSDEPNYERINMKDKTKLAPAVTPMQHTPQEFVERYNALCKEMGFQIVPEPRWAQSKDTGDYRLVIVSQVVALNGGD